MKLKIKITGLKVHDVGYRPFLIALADDFDIPRFSVRNAIEDGKQVVIAKLEADEDQLNDFMDAARSRRPKKAEVLDIKQEPFEGRVPSILKTSMLSMNAQLAKGIAAIETMVDKQDETIAIIGSMNAKMDQMVDKQDKTITAIGSMNAKMDQMVDKQDQMVDKQDETTEAVRELKRSDERFARMEKDIRIIKSKLSIR